MLRIAKGYNSYSKVIGIDLGTTNSAVAIMQGNTPAIIENALGQRTTPSVVAFTADGQELVGVPAKRQAVINPQNTFYATKRLIGRKFVDSEIQRDLTNVSYKIIENERDGAAWLQSRNRKMSPAEIGSLVLKDLKKSAEAYLDSSVERAVITVPAYFNDAQRQATKDAGKMAGLQVLRVLNEPTAAALACGMQKNGIVAVYDFGGGTFDISILDIEDGVFEVRATNGDTHLGGEDADILLVNKILGDFKQQHGIDLSQDRNIVQRIREAAEKAKIELSTVTETTIDLPFVYENKHISMKLTEDELDEMCLELINKTVQPVKKALKDADITTKEVDEVILVGGMTRMPKIRSVVEKVFGQKPNTSVNPDETVALGAAVQAGVLSGEIKNVLLLDVTPLTLGIETYGGVFSPLIPRNTTIPVKKTETFSTGVDNQTGVDIRVFQGERGLVKDNKLIGDFKLAGIIPMPKGQPQIQVTFDIDADGIINVSAKETSTGAEQSITVIGNSGLTEKEIQEIIDVANKNKQQDMLIKSRIELATKADIMISDTENAYKKYKEIISSDQEYTAMCQALESIRADINAVKNGDVSIDVNDLKRNTDEIQKNSLKMFQRSTKRAQEKSKKVE